MKEKRVKCETCNKEFARPEALRKHVRVAHEGLRFDCEQCDLKFKSNEGRKKHFIQFHETKKIELKCEHCEKTFSKKQGLSLHLKMHSKEMNMNDKKFISVA